MIVTSPSPEKIGRLADFYQDKLYLLDGLPPRSEGWNDEQNAQFQQFELAECPPELLPPVVETRDMTVPGLGGDIPVRVYLPDTNATVKDGLSGAVVWIHGGAFVGGDLDMPEADHTARRICAGANVPVISVYYRLCHDGVHHPAPHDDCWSVYAWVQQGGYGIPTDPMRIAVGGGSAGACLAATVGLRGRDVDTRPAGVFLAYPIVHYPRPANSEELNACLDQLPPALQDNPEGDNWLMSNYLGSHDLPAVNPGWALPGMEENLADYPRIYVENCEFDGLRSSGDRFCDQLRNVGVDIEQHTVPGTLHGHLNVPGMPEAVATCAHFSAFVTDVLQ